MRRHMISILLSLLVLPLSCNRPEEIGRQVQPQPRESSFGTGNVATGGFEGRTPNYLDGDLMVYMPMSRYPGKSLGPAYVLVMRLNPGMPTLYDSGLGASDDYLEIAPAQTDVNGHTFRFWYKVSGKPPVEAFSADGQSVIRWLDGNTRLRVQSLSGGARQRRSYSMPRFPSTGSLRVKFPGSIGNIKALRLPVARPAVFRFLRLAVPRSHSLDFAPRRASAPPRPGVDHPVSPAGNLRGDDRISQVPGESPLSVCTCSCRRRQDCSHQTITVPQRGPWTPRCKGSHERSFDAQ